MAELIYIYDNIISIFSALSCCSFLLTLLPLLALYLYSHYYRSTPTLLPGQRYLCCQSQQQNVTAVVNANNKTLPLLSTPTTKRYRCCQRQQQNVTAVVNANNKTLPLLSTPTTKS
jgi:hypothetical protein